VRIFNRFLNPTGLCDGVIRLDPMSAEEFRESLERSVERHARDRVRRGLWAKEAALASSRAEFEQLLPQGQATPHHHFRSVVDATTGTRIGETWYTVEEKGGKVQFWIDWVWIDPDHRRKGHATEVLLRLETEARRLGADRTGLSVWADNPNAFDLYRKLGYVTSYRRMMKPVGPSAEPGTSGRPDEP
jgi:GNAT superfamily N-acetyltransferase